jgi:hypothetical protein
MQGLRVITLYFFHGDRTVRQKMVKHHHLDPFEHSSGVHQTWRVIR